MLSDGGRVLRHDGGGGEGGGAGGVRLVPGGGRLVTGGWRLVTGVALNANVESEKKQIPHVFD